MFAQLNGAFYRSNVLIDMDQIETIEYIHTEDALKTIDPKTVDGECLKSLPDHVARITLRSQHVLYVVLDKSEVDTLLKIAGQAVANLQGSRAVGPTTITVSSAS